MFRFFVGSNVRCAMRYWTVLAYTTTWQTRSTWYVAHMGKERNVYRVSVGIAGGWRLFVRCRCNGKIIIVRWIGKI